MQRRHRENKALVIRPTRWIRRSFSDGVQHFHVSDVVYVKRFLQTHYQSLNSKASTTSVSRPKTPKTVPTVSHSQILYLSVKLDSQDGVGVGVVADFSSFLKMTDLEFPWGLEADDGHQAAGK